MILEEETKNRGRIVEEEEKKCIPTPPHLILNFSHNQSGLLLLSRRKIHPDPAGRQADALVLRHLHAGVISLDESDVHALGAQIVDGLAGELGLVFGIVRRRG